MKSLLSILFVMVFCVGVFAAVQQLVTLPSEMETFLSVAEKKIVKAEEAKQTALEAVTRADRLQEEALQSMTDAVIARTSSLMTSEQSKSFSKRYQQLSSRLKKTIIP